MWQKKFGLQSPVCLSNRFTAMFQEFWLCLGGAPADSFLVKFLAFHILSPHCIYFTESISIHSMAIFENTCHKPGTVHSTVYTGLSNIHIISAFIERLSIRHLPGHIISGSRTPNT